MFAGGFHTGLAFGQVEGEWQPDKQGVVSSRVLKKTRAEVAMCPVCGFLEVIDFQQQRQSVPVIPSIFLNQPNLYKKKIPDSFRAGDYFVP